MEIKFSLKPSSNLTHFFLWMKVGDKFIVWIWELGTMDIYGTRNFGSLGQGKFKHSDVHLRITHGLMMYCIYLCK